MTKINKIKYDIELTKGVVDSTLLIGKINTELSTLKNPFLLTYILESIETMSSNEVENIHSTVDGNYDDQISNNTSSHYVRYREALKQAHSVLTASEILRVKDIVNINNKLLGNNIGIRKTPVTLKNNKGEIIFKPMDASQLPEEMVNLTKEINKDISEDVSPILHTFYIHHRFENIHPFLDGNGRTGRILLASLLTKFDLLNVPASVMSYSISKNKMEYYKGLRSADNGDYENYFKTMLKIFKESLIISLEFIKDFKSRMHKILDTDMDIKESSKNIVIPWFFSGVKVTNRYLVKKTNLNNKTITRYMSTLCELGIAEIERSGKYAPYKNLIIEQLIHKYFENIK